MELDPSIMWDFAGEVVGRIRPATSAVPATVTRVDADGTAWVTTGDGMEAPVQQLTSLVEPGDVVDVQWSGSAARIVANGSDPGAGARMVGAVRNVAVAARDLAKGAKAIADATGQHFWADDNGAHISTEEGNPTGAQNALWNSLGMLFRAGANNLLALVTGTDPGMDVYDGAGNENENVVASFRGSGARIGRETESHVDFDYHSMQLVDKEGNTYFHVSDLRDASGVAEVTDIFDADGVQVRFGLSFQATSMSYTVSVNGTEVTSGVRKGFNYIAFDTAPSPSDVVSVTYPTASWRVKAFTFGIRRQDATVGGFSYAEGRNVAAAGSDSHAEGYATTARGMNSHAEGDNTTASSSSSHAEGSGTTASGARSHAEGYHTTASGAGSHAEGAGTTASGEGSHAEGVGAIASGQWSHAEGEATKASGNYSHVQGYYTEAAYENQTAVGKYNDNDQNNVFEIGNGTADDARSNAFAVDWNGNVKAQGQWQGIAWRTGTSAGTGGEVTTLPAGGTYLLATAHNSTAALNGVWIVRTAANHAFKLAGGGNVTVSVSGTSVTVTTTGGTVNVFYQRMG